jgi:DNA polymerase III delta subunit
MTSIWHISGPRDAGPGERQQMLSRAQAVFDQLDVQGADIVRVDVPGRGAAAEGMERDGVVRGEVEPALPALQSGSLFGGRQGLMIVDGQHLLKGEADVIAELLGNADPETVLVVVSAGAVPSSLSKMLKSGETIKIEKLREKDAAAWLSIEIRTRKIKIPAEAREALLQRFGSNVAAMGQALDQLAGEATITRDTILVRFHNRPDEPMWHLADAISDGKVGEALRRLADFLTHGHPLQLLGYFEDDLKRRSLASAAGSIDEYAKNVGARPGDWRVKRDWNRRSRVSDSELRAALSALLRADGLLKSAPEETHRLTMERLTVALCRLYGGRPVGVG